MRSDTQAQAGNWTCLSQSCPVVEAGGPLLSQLSHGGAAQNGNTRSAGHVAVGAANVGNLDDSFDSHDLYHCGAIGVVLTTGCENSALLAQKRSYCYLVAFGCRWKLDAALIVGMRQVRDELLWFALQHKGR